MPLFVIQLLERHFGAAVSEASRQQLDVAKLHAATVTATLNAINAYAEWAPIPDLSKYGLIHGYDLLKHILEPHFKFSVRRVDISLSVSLIRCGFLLSSPDFRLHACEFFKLVSSRYGRISYFYAIYVSYWQNIGCYGNFGLGFPGRDLLMTLLQNLIRQ